MRRRTSAMIAGALGAGLTASIVLAQQIPSSGVGPRAGSGASGPSSSEPASLYGAAGSRGARYLLRNGLDYLQYQQYERALKFLRKSLVLKTNRLRRSFNCGWWSNPKRYSKISLAASLSSLAFRNGSTRNMRSAAMTAASPMECQK